MSSSGLMFMIVVWLIIFVSIASTLRTIVKNQK